MINTYKGCVQPWQCDNFGHMNVQFYVACFDEATWHLLADCGISSDYFKTNNKAIVAVEQHIEYIKEVFSGDLVSIYSKLIEVRPKAVRMFHQMRKTSSDEVVAEIYTTGVHIDMKTRKAVPFSNELMNQLIYKVVE